MLDKTLGLKATVNGWDFIPMKRAKVFKGHMPTYCRFTFGKDNLHCFVEPGSEKNSREIAKQYKWLWQFPGSGLTACPWIFLRRKVGGVETHGKWNLPI